jgi:hypothetical protein
MSAAERLSRARSLQGFLTAEQWVTLKSDLFRLLDGKKYPKAEAQLRQELVRNLGWDRRKIFGPRPFVSDCLDDLEGDGLMECDYEDTGDLFSVRRRCWRKNNGEGVFD